VEAVKIWQIGNKRKSRQRSRTPFYPAASETLLAIVAVGVTVRTGAPKPDISTADAVKRLLLGSKAISHPNASGAGAGISFNETLQKLGIADAMKPKIKIAQGGRGAMELLAKGEVDIGLTFVSEIITEPGVEVVGPLPRGISTPTVLVGFVSSHSKEPEAAKAVLRYLSSPELRWSTRNGGCSPGSLRGLPSHSGAAHPPPEWLRCVPKGDGVYSAMA